MSVDRLREAAALLRERAEAADILGARESWAIWDDIKPDGYIVVGNSGGVIPPGEWAVEGEHNPVANAYTPETGIYIALMGPPVALALADWLDDTASEVESHATWSEHALAVADAILGDDR